MNELKDQNTTNWWIAHNGTNVFHTGECPVGTVVTTGQPILESMSDKTLWANRCTQLGITSENYL